MATDPGASATDEPTTDTPDLGDAGKKALEAERKARREAEKQLKELQAKVAEFEDRDKTETERVSAKLADAEKRAAEAEMRALRLEVAQDKGLTAAQAKRLVGSTREELEADADELLETFAPASKEEPEVPAGKPTVDLKPGSGDPTVDPEPDIRAVVADIPRGL